MTTSRQTKTTCKKTEMKNNNVKIYLTAHWLYYITYSNLYIFSFAGRSLTPSVHTWRILWIETSEWDFGCCYSCVRVFSFFHFKSGKALLPLLIDWPDTFPACLLISKISYLFEIQLFREKKERRRLLNKCNLSFTDPNRPHRTESVSWKYPVSLIL